QLEPGDMSIGFVLDRPAEDPADGYFDTTLSRRMLTSPRFRIADPVDADDVEPTEDSGEGQTSDSDTGSGPAVPEVAEVQPAEIPTEARGDESEADKFDVLETEVTPRHS